MKRYIFLILMVVLLLTFISYPGKYHDQDDQTAENSSTSAKTAMQTTSALPDELQTEETVSTESVSEAYLDIHDYGPIGMYAYHIAAEISDTVGSGGSPCISQIDNVPAASVGLTVAHNLYRMQFDLIKQGGTEILHHGDVYFCMTVLDEFDTEHWQRSGYITADELENTYNTPEMLDRFGDKYTAAAMYMGDFNNDTELILPEDCTVHTEAFHTISDTLIELVDKYAYRVFRDRYAGTEAFNVLNFLSYFYLDIENVQGAMNKYGAYPSPYTAADLHGDVQTQREIFLLPEYRSSDVQLYYGLPTLAECRDIVGWNDTKLQFALSAFLRNDCTQFACLCGVKPEVYAYMQGMKISDYTLTKELFEDPYYPENFNPYPVLTFTVTESQNDIFPEGEHTLIWEHGIHLSFASREAFHTPVGDMSAAERYIYDVHSDRDFSSILAEGMSQWGLCDFIIARLNCLHSNNEPRTADEIGDYAEKYLGVDRTTLRFEQTVDKTPDGRYVRIGRGSTSYYHTFLSEEIRDGITVVTVQFWADPSQTVPSRKVEFYLELIDGEYKPIHTVILEDSPFESMYVSS